VTALRLLVTRPEPDATRTADELRAKGHDVMVAPMLNFEPTRDAALGGGPWTGVLLTSANAARAIAQHAQFAALKDLPVLAVGDRTADVAREFGFGDVTSAAGDANALARVAAARFGGAQATLLYAAAEQRAVDLAEMLAPEGVRVRTTVVYRMAKQSALPVDVAVALKAGTLDGVLHYSRRSAEAYLDCVAALGGHAPAPMHYCLSADVAKPLTAAGTDRIHIALRPDEPALFDLLTLA
jgi:uroporphyrinogen-III synthase